MNKFEKLKAEKDGLDVYDALIRASRDGWESLDDDDVKRLKWYGLYQHKQSFGGRWLALTGAHERVFDPAGYRIGRLAQRVARLAGR